MASKHAELQLNSTRLLPVLLGVHLVALPLYTHLPWLVLCMMALFTLWSITITLRLLPLPAQWLRLLLALLVVAVLLTSYGTLFGQMPGTAMVLLLLFLKLFEMNSKRDVAVVIFLCYFLTASMFFHSQSLWVALYVFAVTIYLTSLLIIYADRLETIGLRERVQLAARMVVQSLPLLLILFVLFPRIPGPLWGLPKDALAARTGISEEMSPGSINQLIATNDVAFRIKFDGDAPAHAALYWRGLVLSAYDGNTWRRDDAPSYTAPEVAITQAAPALRYSVTLEPHQQTWLFALEQMTAYDDALRVTRELQLFARERVNNALNYRMTAVLDAVNQGMYAPERSKNLRLPTAFNPQTQQLGKRMRMRAGSDTEIIKQALEYFASNAFVYTLSPDVLGEHAMDDFLFNTRRGFCEHYASAFVYLMRAAGLPARVVIGYQGGEMNPQDAYMIVRQSDAHAWAEVWVDDARWLRVDPTAAVSPLRIERGIQSAGLEPQLLPRLLLANNALLQRLRYRWDSFQHQWNQWVIGFDETRQRELFKLLGINDVKKSDLVLWLVVAMSFAGALVAWWVIRSNPFGERDRVRKAYAIFKRKLARRGIKVSAQDTPRELLEKICHQLPATQSAANAILSQYQQLVYGSSRNRESEHIFMRAVRRFRVA